MKKKIGAFGARQFSLGTLVGGRPGTTIFQNPEGGGGDWGVSHTRTGPGRPPRALSAIQVLLGHEVICSAPSQCHAGALGAPGHLQRALKAPSHLRCTFNAM